MHVTQLIVIALAAMVWHPWVHCYASELVPATQSRQWLDTSIDGLVLSTGEMNEATQPVSLLLQRCDVRGQGLRLLGRRSSENAATLNVSLHLTETRVWDSTVYLLGYLPDAFELIVTELTASMEDSTALFDFQNAYSGNKLVILLQRVFATWRAAPGGSVIRVGAPAAFVVRGGSLFSLSQSTINGAAHVIEITEQCTRNACMDSDDSLTSFDMIRFENARGAFFASQAEGTALSLSGYSMTRFSNITMTGQKPFYEALRVLSRTVTVNSQGHFVLSAIESDGPLFKLSDAARFELYGMNTKFTLRHINVASTGITDSYPVTIPAAPTVVDTNRTTYILMSNITVAGVALTSLASLESHGLFASQLADASDHALEMRGEPWPVTEIGQPVQSYCILHRSVESVPEASVQLPSCHCTDPYAPPYCTAAADPLIYVDGYSPAATACNVLNCEACLFGRPSVCGACGRGYTQTQGCEVVPCHAAFCEVCTPEDNTVCETCQTGYAMTTAGVCERLTCPVPYCAECVLNSLSACRVCHEGYALSAEDGATCVEWTCDVSHCEVCVKDTPDICARCAEGYALQLDGVVCVAYACGVPDCVQCSATDADVCAECAEGFVMSSDGTGSCTPETCVAAHCKRCVGGAPSRCDVCEAGYWFDRGGGCTKCRAGYRRRGSECVKETAALTILVAAVWGGQCALLLFAFFLAWWLW